MVTTFCVSGAVLAKAGKNVSSEVVSGSLLVGTDIYVDNYIKQAENLINTMSRVDWIAAFAGLSASTKLLLEQVCSDLAAMYAIQYDMGGYTTRTEAETMLDVLRDSSLRGLSLLRDQKQKDFVNGT